MGRGGRERSLVRAPRLRYFQTRDNDPLVKKWGHALVQCLLICLPLHENMENLLEKLGKRGNVYKNIYDILSEIYEFQRK